MRNFLPRPGRYRRHVLVAHADLAHLVEAAEQALGEQEAGRQVNVVARSAHRHREGLAVHPDLERLLDREQVGPVLRSAGHRYPQHPPPGRHAAHNPRLLPLKAVCRARREVGPGTRSGGK